MKSLNKIFALLLALIMCVSLVVMASCKKDDGGDDNPIGGSEDAYNKTEEYEVFDMEGSTINFLGFYGIVSTGDTATTETGILQVERRKEIEEKYNCTFKQEIITNDQGAVATAMRNGYMADQVYADLFCTFDTSARGLMNEGMLFPASDAIDFSRPQWNPKITAYGTKDGKTYYFSPDPTNMESLVRFYPQYLEQYSMENPHDLIKQGKWTTDKFLEMAQKITSLGSKNGVYGANSVRRETSISSTLALFGTEWVREEDGMYYSNLDDPKIVEALNWQIAVNKTAPPEDATDTICVLAWPAGNSGLPIVSPTDDNKYSFCTGPLSPYTTVAPNVCQAANVRAMISLIDQGEDPDRGIKVGTIYSYYCEPLGGSVEEQDKLTRSQWEDKLYDEESVETILAGIKEGGGSMYTWHLGGGISQVHNTGSWASDQSVIAQAIKNEAGIQSAIDAQKDALEAALDAVNKANDF